MEIKTTELRALDSSIVSETERLYKTLMNAIPEKTRLVPLVYVLAHMLTSLIQPHCKDVSRDALSLVIKEIIDILTMPESAQQQKEDEQDTPDENQEPQPQL